MSVNVTKSSPVLVGPFTAPATPTTGHINLSSFDKAHAFFPITSFHVFGHAIREPAETIRRALSRALVHYFPIAGRAAAAGGSDGGGGGELRIACTGEGVAFVAASANCSLADVKLFDPPFATLLKELAMDYGAEVCGQSDPLMHMQVTEFACGGFVAGVTRNHVVGDGKGMAQFLGAVGELARGLPRPSVFPVSCGDDDGSLPEMPRFAAAIDKRLLTLPPQDFAYLDITIPSRVIDRVKDGFPDGPCTAFEAAVAILWQSRTRVVMSNPQAPAPLIFYANARRHVGAKDGYYGNCITSQVVLVKIW